MIPAGPAQAMLLQLVRLGALLGIITIAMLATACGGGDEPTAEQLAAEQARFADHLAAQRRSISPPDCEAHPEQCR